jgi:hypothetical protein
MKGNHAMQNKEHLYTWAKSHAAYFCLGTKIPEKQMLAAINEVIDAWENLGSEPPDVYTVLPNRYYETFVFVRRALENAHYSWSV